MPDDVERRMAIERVARHRQARRTHEGRLTPRWPSARRSEWSPAVARPCRRCRQSAQCAVGVATQRSHAAAAARPPPAAPERLVRTKACAVVLLAAAERRRTARPAATRARVDHRRRDEAHAAVVRLASCAARARRAPCARAGTSPERRTRHRARAARSTPRRPCYVGVRWHTVVGQQLLRQVLAAPAPPRRRRTASPAHPAGSAPRTAAFSAGNIATSEPTVSAVL